MKKKDLVDYLDSYLKIDEIKDSSKNGLQVDNSKNEVRKIGYAVDATTYIFEKAVSENVDFILVHHGIFWGVEQPIRGVMYERLKKLLLNDIALYAAHLPLDLHEEVGNNIGLARNFINFFGLKEFDLQATFEYSGYKIAYGLRFGKKILTSDLKGFLEENNLQMNFFNFGGKKVITSIVFCSGACGDMIKNAKNQNYDIILTGEAAHYHLTLAKEINQSVILAGHRETEVFGPKLLSEHLKRKFGLKIVFLDEKY